VGALWEQRKGSVGIPHRLCRAHHPCAHPRRT